MMKKLFAILAIFTILSSSILVPIANAQVNNFGSGQWWNPSPNQFADKVQNAPDSEIFGERYTLAQVNWIINSLMYLIAGAITGCSPNGQVDPVCIAGKLKGQASVPSGAILAVAAGIDTLRTQRPASGIEYVASTLERFEIIPSANAQGYGFQQSLIPVQAIWSVTRNASYALLTLSIIILGFMIMFRAKISPQASITVQSALPRVVIGIIFITFSYAIAGFLIDLTFLSFGLLAAVIKSVPNISTKNTVELFTALNDNTSAFIAYGIAFIAQSISYGGVLAKIGAGLTAIPDVIISVLLFIVLLIALIRVFWLLIKSYAIVLFLVIGAPFVGIIYIARPSGNMIADWFKAMFANLSVFFGLGAILIMSHILFFGLGNGKGWLTDILQAQINPFGINLDMVTNQAVGRFPGGFSFVDLSAIGLFVSLAFMMSAPSVLNQLKSYIMTGKAAFGFDMGGAAAAGGFVGGLAGGAAGNYLQGYELRGRKDERTGLGQAYKEGNIVRYLGASALQRASGFLGGGGGGKRR